MAAAATTSSTTTKIRIKEFDFTSMYESCTWAVIGAPGSGKSTFIENMLYFCRKKYPLARAFVGSAPFYVKMTKIIPPLFVTMIDNPLKELEEPLTRHNQRCHECALIRESKHKDDPTYNDKCILILDDVTSDPKIYRWPEMNKVLKHGSQHWNQVTLIAAQYAIDLPRALRKCFSYVALGREMNDDDRERLYRNFGGICGSRQIFDTLMDKLTGDHTFMIIKMRSESNNVEDCVFYYKVHPIVKKWKFGSKAVWKWSAQRLKLK